MNHFTCVIVALSYQAESALHVAVACDNKEIAELLLIANAIVDKRNKVLTDLDYDKLHLTKPFVVCRKVKLLYKQLLKMDTLI